MTSKKNECAIVQENLAWGKALSALDQEHVLSCPHCSAIAVDFEEIDSMIKNAEDFTSYGFANQVMAQIALNDKSEDRSFLNLRESVMMLLNNQVFRWGIGGTSFLLAFSAH